MPSGAAVVVPPRSAMTPLVRTSAPTRRRLRPDDAVALGPISDRSGVSPALLLLLPLVAAAVLAAILSGGNEAGGHSGPVRTR